MLVPTDIQTLASSQLDLTDSLDIRTGETWLCEMTDEPNSIECCLLSASRRQTRALNFDGRNDRTCFLMEESDYQPDLIDRNSVHLWDWTQLTLPSKATFALTCIEAGKEPPSSPWVCLYPTNPEDLDTRNSIWIDIDCDNLEVDWSVLEQFLEFRVSEHPNGWAAS